MNIEKINCLEEAGKLHEEKFIYNFNRPSKLENPMPKLCELVQAVIKCVGKQQFLKSQSTILGQWASDSGYSMEHDPAQKLFTFTHFSLLK